MRTVNLIVVHCSAGKLGTAATLRKFHMAPPPEGRGWADIGYHFVIRNGWATQRRFVEADVGLVEQGRDVQTPGAHAGPTDLDPVGHNAHSIGVCLVGPPFHDDQIEAAVELVTKLCTQYGLDPQTQVKGHRELLGVKKTCPIIDMDQFRSRVKLHAGA